MVKLTTLAVSALALTGMMQAEVLTSSTGLGSQGITPVYTFAFDNTPGLATNSTITNQYAFAGVSFSSPAFYDGNSGTGANCNFSNVNGDCVSNFSSNGGGILAGPTTPFSILFATPQSYAAFALVTGASGANNTTLSAFRGNTQVDSGTFTTSTTNPVNYVGFYGESTPFDRITITTGSNLIILDNLQVSAVPEPATVGMLALGLGSVVAFARRRSKA